MKLMILAGAFAAMSAPAIAQSQCGAESVVAESLRGGYGEAPVSSGVAANGMLMVMWVSPETGTWTITLNNGAGVECLFASGDGFEALAPEPNL